MQELEERMNNSYLAMIVQYGRFIEYHSVNKVFCILNSVCFDL